MNRPNTRIIAMDEHCCIMWVSGAVISIDQVVDWIGGFLCPKQDDSYQYTMMHTEPAGSIEGDIIVVLTDDPMVYVQNSYQDLVESKLDEWGIQCDE